MSVLGSYLSVDEAAQRIGVRPKTIEHWIALGVLLARPGSHTQSQVATKVIEQWAHDFASLPVMSPVASEVLKIAVIEDDPDIVQLLTMSIDGFEFQSQVYSAADGWQGLILSHEFRPDVVIADLNMPQMDGFRLLAALEASEFAPKKIIAITALSDADIQMRGGLPARTILLRKPIALDALEAHVRPSHHP